MLAANRDQLVASLQAGAQDLRWKELDSVMARYTGMIGVASLAAGFAFSAMVELDMPSSDEYADASSAQWHWIYAFYMFITVSLVSSLYVVSFSATAIAAGSRLALQGDDRSTTRAVAVLLQNFRSVFIGSFVSMLAIIGAAMCIVWIKLEDYYLEAISGGMFVVGGIFIVYSLHRLRAKLAIRSEEMVTGAVNVGSGGKMVDLTQVALAGRQDDRASMLDARGVHNV